MVMGVGLRLLHNRQDAEDVCQATFLLLAKKANSTAWRDLIGNWLYEVAYRVAKDALKAARRRKLHEGNRKPSPVPDAMADITLRDLQTVLDEELTRLPGKFRLPLILCCLEGKARDEVARGLGIPLATVKSRLEEGRELLRRRLASRGVHLSVALAGLTLVSESARAAVPATLVGATSSAALAALAGQITPKVVSANVLALFKGGIQTMFLTKLKTATAALVLLAAVAVGAGGLLYQTQAAEQQQPPKGYSKSEPVKAPPGVPVARGGDKPQAALKPVIVKDNEAQQLKVVGWGADGKTVVTFGLTFDIVESKDADGNPTKVKIPNNTIKIWDAATGKLKQSLGEEKHTHVFAVDFARDRKTAAIGYYKHDRQAPTGGSWNVRIVNATTWESKHEINHADVEMNFSTIALSPDGKTLVLAGWRFGMLVDKPLPIVKLWDIEKERLIPRKPKADEPALGKYTYCLAFSPDGKVLAAGDRDDAKIRLFDGLTGEPGAVLDDHGGAVYGIAFSPDGKTLASCSEDKTVKLWDVPAGKLRQTLKGSKGMLYSVAFSPDGKRLAAGGNFKLEKDKWQSEERGHPLGCRDRGSEADPPWPAYASSVHAGLFSRRPELGYRWRRRRRQRRRQVDRRIQSDPVEVAWRRRTGPNDAVGWQCARTHGVAALAGTHFAGSR